nr:hypothetical protein [Tanacetum cinerariifolium]
MCSIQHKIDLIPDSALPNKPAYHTNPEETTEIQRQVDGLLEKGLIQESFSPCAVLTLLVPKKNGEWRMCMDSRSINKITIKYRFPIPRLNDLLDEHHGATIFSKVDLRSGYHQIRIYEGDEWKTTFKTKEGLYEWLGIQVDDTKIQAIRDCPIPIRAVLSQSGRPIAYFSEKLNDAKRRYTTYDKEFYAIIRALDHWQHYLISKEFILHSDHEDLKYIQGQHKLLPRHAKWVEFLHVFNFTIKHKSGKLNKGADALSRKYSLLNHLQPKIIGFELLKHEYPTDPDFGWEELLPRAEFAYNRALNETTGISPFKVVYGLNPATPLDLAVLNTTSKFSKEASDLAMEIQTIHQQVHDKITKNNELLKYRRDKGRKHVLFKPGDLVWLHMRKERFPTKRRSKLSPRSDGPFKVLEKVNDNVYKIDLPGIVSTSYLLSTLIVTLSSSECVSLLSSLFNHNACVATTVAAMNSDLHDDSATVACFCVLQLIGDSP